MDNYNILHCHTDLSNGTTIIDSVSKYTQYIDRAKELNMNAIAFTEHGNMFSWFDKKTYCEQNGIKYIHAVEMYFTATLNEKVRDNYHVCLYAKNDEGFKELNKLVSSGYNRDDNHFYYVPRISFEELQNTSDNIIISTACLGGGFKKSSQLQEEYIKFLAKNNHRCFLEIQHHLIDEQIDYNNYMKYLSNKYNVPLIIATDTHALNEIHAESRLILQNAESSVGLYIDNEDGWDLTFKTFSELKEMFEKQGVLNDNEFYNAIENTHKIADMVEGYNIDLSYKYPKLYNNSLDILKQKINEGIVKRGVNKLPNYQEYIDRINVELETYIHNNAIDYLLLDEDLKKKANAQNIYPGCSRGSVSGSIIAYLIGITDMDSIKHKLNFERFMNSYKVSLADIDTDWSPNEREKVKDILYNNKDFYCSEIITFNTLKSKGAIRKVGKALNIDLKHVNAICKAIDLDEPLNEYMRLFPELFKYAEVVRDVIVSTSIHPCGTIVSPIPLDENTGLVTVKTCNKPVSMISTNEVNNMFYVKLDVLGLDNMELINKTCELANIKRLTPDNVPYDEKVWKAIRDNTLGIFQWNSGTGSQYIKKLFSDNTIHKIKQRFKELNLEFNYIDLLSVGNGAIRPGGASYREQLANGIFYDNGHEGINKLLASTLGYCIEENQLVATTTGLKKIKDITEEDFVYTINGVNKVFHKTFMGKKEIVKIKTKCTELLSTKDHKILTSEGWKMAKDIKVGDSVAYRVGNNNIQKHDINFNQIIGYLIGDGMLTTGHAVSFINKDLDVVKKFIKCVENLCPNTTCSITHRGSRVNNIDLYVALAKHKIHKKHRNELCLKLQEIGFKFKSGGGLGAKNKFIPSFIFNGDNESMLAFLGAYTDTDSCIKNKNKIQLTYKTSSLHLAKDLVEICRLLGFIATITHNNTTDSYNITVNNSKKMLYLLYDYSIKIQKNIDKKDLMVCTRTNDSLIRKKYIKAMFDKIGISGKKIYKTTGVGLYAKNEYISLNNIKKIDKKFPNIIPKIILNKNIKWVVVEDIIEGATSNVYDIEVENEHNFICQGLIVHNCVYQEQVMDFLVQFCGYSKGESDIIRRAIAKKKNVEQYLEEIKTRFIDTQKDLERSKAENIIDTFLQVVYDASDYLFSLNHSTAYSYIGYMCGWLREHYTLEFLTVALNNASSSLEKTEEIIEYAKSKGINILQPTFGKSKSEYFFDKQTNTIYKGIASIKYLNDEVAEILYNIYQNNNLKYFYQTLNEIKKHPITSRHIEVLIKIGYFNMFGSRKKLMNLWNIYTFLTSKKQFRMTDYEGYSKHLLEKYSKVKTKTLYKEVDVNSLMEEVEISTPNIEYDSIDIVKYEIEYMGTSQYTDSQIDINLYVVIEEPKKYPYNTILYNITTGTKLIGRVTKSDINKYPISNLDIINVVSKEYKYKKIFKDGRWINDINEQYLSISYIKL